MGAYRDYAKVFYKDRQGNEIFASGTDKDYDFARFHKLAYKKKNIMAYSFQNAIFTECIFKDVNMAGCDFTDCRFINCSFDNVSISGGRISGCLWLDGRLRKVSFDEVFCKSGVITENGKLIDICKKAEFRGVIMNEVCFSKMDKEECDFTECIYGNDEETAKEAAE